MKQLQELQAKSKKSSNVKTPQIELEMMAEETPQAARVNVSRPKSGISRQQVLAASKEKPQRARGMDLASETTHTESNFAI